MRRQELLADLDRAAIDIPDAVRRRPILFIDSGSQTLRLVKEDKAVASVYTVSTSRHGLGQQQDSYRTPSGWHRIAEKIGEGEPEGLVFRARQSTGQVCESYAPGREEEDVITSRILWLDGLQPGFNRGGEVDSRNRFIYIHGTADEAHIGQAVSIGCVRMTNHDVIELFEQVEVGDLVLIA